MHIAVKRSERIMLYYSNITNLIYTFKKVHRLTRKQTVADVYTMIRSFIDIALQNNHTRYEDFDFHCASYWSTCMILLHVRLLIFNLLIRLLVSFFVHILKYNKLWLYITVIIQQLSLPVSCSDIFGFSLRKYLLLQGHIFAIFPQVSVVLWLH